MGVTIGGPDINTCQRDFTTDGDTVRYGLAAVKGVGPRAVDTIVEARKTAGRFRDLYHFCRTWTSGRSTVRRPRPSSRPGLLTPWGPDVRP